MTDKTISPSIAALRKLEATLGLHLSAAADEAGAESPSQPFRPARVLVRLRSWRNVIRWPVVVARRGWRQPVIRRTAYAGAALLLALTLTSSFLWWRLSKGPISLDIATPWLAAAVERNLGGSREVEVGGTQIERDEDGRVALRMRDIVVRDSDGTVVASAPKAEIGISAMGLLTGQVRAERLSLVGAGMSLRIEQDGNLTVFAGADNRPIATASAAADTISTAAVRSPERSAPPAEQRLGESATALASLIAWIDRLGASGLDGRDLDQIGLKNGQLVIDDQRSGKRWSFDNIDLSVIRPKQGGVAVKLGSGGPERTWSLNVVVGPTTQGNRAVQLVADKVPLKELLLALHVGGGQIDTDLPLSASFRAAVGPDGKPDYLQGRLVTGGGYITDLSDPDLHFDVGRVDVSVEWDAERRAFRAPFQLVVGGNRFTSELRGTHAPGNAGNWSLMLSGGTAVLGPLVQGEENLILDRLLARVRLDFGSERVQVDQLELGNPTVKVALSGAVDFSSSESRLALGLAANSMSMSTFKRVWPSFIAPKPRQWIHERVSAGTVERVVIATNMPLSSLRPGESIPDDGLSVDITTTGTVLTPVMDLPPIRDADLEIRVSGRTASVTLGRGVIVLPSGRKLALSQGAFEVPDHHPPGPMSRTRLRLDGPVPAVAEFLSLGPLGDVDGIPLDPATSRGTVSAQVGLELPLLKDLSRAAVSYTTTMDVTNFVAERMVMGHKVEAAALRVTANAGGYLIKGDVKVNGVPAALEYRKVKGEPDAELRLQAILDDAGRTKFALDSGDHIDGPVPVKIVGRVAPDRDNRFTVEADLTPAKVENLVPGWVKPAGKPVRASFVLVSKPQSTRFEDLLVEGSGALVKGSIELDDSGDILSASFPVFSLSDGDKATLKAERTEGVLRVTLRGDVFDGRGFLKSAMAGSSGDAKRKRKSSIDLDLDVKLATVAGFHGETLRSIDLRLGRRNGQIRNFALSGKLGRDAPLIGDLRGRGGGRQVMYFETTDAGALFRLTDTYAKISGGQMWVAMDPPTSDSTPLDGILNIRDFVVRGEAALDRVASSGPGNPRGGVEFSRLRLEFTKLPGRFTIRDGLVRGPVIGATIDGAIDYARDEVRMRGTFVPLYGLNNMFGQIPIVGMFLGGSNEGLVGITYEVVGAPSSPVLRVNPISAVAPGVFRKLFEFPSASGRNLPEPVR